MVWKVNIPAVYVAIERNHWSIYLSSVGGASLFGTYLMLGKFRLNIRVTHQTGYGTCSIEIALTHYGH